MQKMVEKGEDVEDIAAHFFLTAAVVRLRLKLASASPALHELYAAEATSLEQLWPLPSPGQSRRQGEETRNSALDFRRIK